MWVQEAQYGFPGPKLNRPCWAFPAREISKFQWQCYMHPWPWFCVLFSCSAFHSGALAAWLTLAWHRHGSFDSCSLQNVMDLHNHTSVWNVSSHLPIMLFNDFTTVYRLVACVNSAWNLCGSLDSGSIIEHYGLHKHTFVWNVWLRNKQYNRPHQHEEP